MFLKNPDEHYRAHRSWMRLLGRITGSMALATFVVGKAHSSEAFVASLEPDSKAAISVIVRQAETDPIVRVSGVDAITVPVQGGNSTIFSASNADIELSQRSSELLAALSFRPGEQLQYRVKFGAVSDFALEYSSGSQTNELQSFDNGFIWGLGIGGLIHPGSIVSMAVSWELGFTQRLVGLDKFNSALGTQTVDQRFEQDEYQGSITMSRRWKDFEPFGGLKVIHLASRLKDESTKHQVSGSTDGVSPFVGAQWWISAKEQLRIEGSFIDEESVHASLGVSF